MNIDNQNINIDDLYDQKYMHKEVKKGIRGLITKFIIAVVIFFLPSIMNGIYPLITGFDMVEKDYDVCMECFTHPKGNYCLKKVEVYNENNSK